MKFYTIMTKTKTNIIEHTSNVYEIQSIVDKNQKLWKY